MTDLFPTIAIETVNRCTRKCWFCKFGQPRGEEPYTLMPWELIEKLVDNLADLNYAGRVSWYRINEPLMDKRLVGIVALTRAKLPAAFVSVLSNGDLLTETKLAALLTVGCDRVGVSAYDAATHARFAANPAVTLIDRREPTETKFVENRGGNIKLLNLAVRDRTAEMADRPCHRPATMLNVLADGKVCLCCADLHGDVILGDAATTRLEDIWRSPAYAAVRERLKGGRRGLSLCDGCSHDGRGHPREYP